jgi:hypothetical protein
MLTRRHRHHDKRTDTDDVIASSHNGTSSFQHPHPRLVPRTIAIVV